MDETDLSKTAGSVAYGFVKSFLGEKKEDAKTFFVRYRVGFLPPGMDYSEYQMLRQGAVYKQLKFIIGPHKTLGIVLSGLYIGALPKDERKRVCEKHRDRIYKTHGREGVAILNIAQTGFVEGYVKWLTGTVLENNLSKEEAIQIYEDSIRQWDRTTIFVKNEDKEHIVFEKCKSKIVSGQNVFFVFASYEAILVARDVFRELRKEHILEDYEYSVITDKLHNTEKELVWIVQKITGAAINLDDEQ